MQARDIDEFLTLLKEISESLKGIKEELQVVGKSIDQSSYKMGY